MFEIREVIDLAIQIEKNGEKIYRNALKSISNPAVYSRLQKLADEEVDHIEWFSSLKQKLKSTTDDPQFMEIGKTILNSVLGDQSFSLKDVDFSKIDRVNDLLKLVIKFERDTILFYDMIRPLIDGTEELAHLDTIIAEENQHMQLLQEILDSDSFE